MKQFVREGAGSRRVHNHGPEDGPGLACNELRQPDGSLRGACLDAADSLSLHAEMDEQNEGTADPYRASERAARTEVEALRGLHADGCSRAMSQAQDIEAERDDLREALARVEALCEAADLDAAYGGRGMVSVPALRAALSEAVCPNPTAYHYPHGDCPGRIDWDRERIANDRFESGEYDE